jgi:hypothetical protein
LPALFSASTACWQRLPKPQVDPPVRGPACTLPTTAWIPPISHQRFRDGLAFAAVRRLGFQEVTRWASWRSAYPSRSMSSSSHLTHWDATLSPGGERWMVEEAFAAAGAVIAGRCPISWRVGVRSRHSGCRSSCRRIGHERSGRGRNNLHVHRGCRDRDRVGEGEGGRSERSHHGWDQHRRSGASARPGG